jgi:hypothetical protein
MVMNVMMSDQSFFLDKRQQVPDFKLIKPSKVQSDQLLSRTTYSFYKKIGDDQ